MSIAPSPTVAGAPDDLARDSELLSSVLHDVLVETSAGRGAGHRAGLRRQPHLLEEPALDEVLQLEPGPALVLQGGAGQVHPRRSAAMKRLTIRSSSEW